MAKTHNDCEPDCGRGYYCHVCTTRIRTKSWKNLTESQRDYDRMMTAHRDRVAGASLILDEPWDSEYPQECSCHISPPCMYCIDSVECEECGDFYNPEVELECCL